MYNIYPVRLSGSAAKTFLHLPAVLVCTLLTAFCLTGLTGCSLLRPVTEKTYWVAPTIQPSIQPEMKTAGFWIGQINEPDRIILNRREIQALNQDIRERLELTRDIARLPDTFEGSRIVSDIRRWLVRFRDSRRYYRADGRPAPPEFFADLEQKMNLPVIPARVPAKWGLITAAADQRLLPTPAPLYKEAGDIDFDRLQNNGLDIGTAVAILHQSIDGQWFWVKGPASDGWVRADQTALCRQEILEDIKKTPFVTVIRAKASLYRDRAMTRYAGFVRMGTRFKLLDISQPDCAAVMLPFRLKSGQLEMQTGYLKAGEIVRGSLPYTRRHIIEQAFEMLNVPYGWGGSHGNQDCSQFIQSVFSTVGIQLPRNSAAQARVGRDLVTFDTPLPEHERRASVISSGLPAASLLYMKGHIMLYLGNVMDKPYVIHDLWGYRDSGIWGDRIRVTNRVVITGLELGRGTGRGSLLKLLKSVRGMF